MKCYNSPRSVFTGTIISQQFGENDDRSYNHLSTVIKSLIFCIHVALPPSTSANTSLTHSLTAALDQLRVVASSTSNDPGPRSRQHQQIGQYISRWKLKITPAACEQRNTASSSLLQRSITLTSFTDVNDDKSDRFSGSLSLLHTVDEDAVSSLTNNSS